MIPIREFVTLAKAIPKASITEPKEGVSWILDTNGEAIGAIHWNLGNITLFEDYEHIDLVVERIGKHVEDAVIEFELPEDNIELPDESNLQT